MLNVPGYYIVNELRRDRSDTQRGAGGGILVYAKTHLKISPIDINSDYIQAVAFKIDLSDKDDGRGCSGKTPHEQSIFKILAFYRSPNSSAENTSKLAELIIKFKDFDLMTGDLNLPGICWQSKTSDLKGSEILDSVESCGLEQQITFPTHRAGNILDVAFTQVEHHVTWIDNIGNIGSSDHTAILLKFAIHFGGFGSIAGNFTLRKSLEL